MRLAATHKGNDMHRDDHDRYTFITFCAVAVMCTGTMAGFVAILRMYSV